MGEAEGQEGRLSHRVKSVVAAGPSSASTTALTG
jgi:hypothetical protein